MKLIIAGGREYQFNVDDVKYLIKLNREYPIVEIVSGGARGADREGEWFAKEMDIPIKVFPADWNKYKKRAGYLRNKQMGSYADAVVLFPGGKGTSMMYEIAQENGLLIFDRRNVKER